MSMNTGLPKFVIKNEHETDSVLIKVQLCFFLSGLAALLYQTVWMRQLSVVFGTSELAVVTVLTAYMAGLSLGAAIAAKYLSRVTRPLLTYGLLEAGIAISALLVPVLLLVAGSIAKHVLGGQVSPPQASGFGQLLFYFLSTLLILVIPTALMGATLPLLIKYVVHTNEQVGTRIGELYSINTFGAVAGTLLAAFALLPFFSLTNTILIGALINFAVLAIVFSIINTRDTSAKTDTLITAAKVEQLEKNNRLEPEDRSSESKYFRQAQYGWILPIMTFSGVATFTYEVLWTRLIAHILGGSVAAFAIMLAGFLIGIAIGSAIAAKLARDQQRAQRWFVISQIGIACLSALTYFLINATVPENSGLLSNSVLALCLLLPSTLFIGATFPLAVRMLANSEKDAPAATARIYAWNTVGAISGATAAGYFLIPAVKYAGAIQFAVYLNLCLACATLFLGSGSRALKTVFSAMAANPNLSRTLRLLPFFLLVLSALLYRPQWPENVVTFSSISSDKPSSNDILYYEVGRSSTVILLDNETHFSIRNNGLPEAEIAVKGAIVKGLNAQMLLSVLPVIARPKAESMLVVGFGGGVALERIPPSIEEVDVLELEPKVIQANQLISAKRLHDPFTDSRVNIIYNDARSALQLTDKRYDIIVSQPSHPWTAGASHLYTQEFMQLAQQHMTEKGVFLQWMNTDFTSEHLLKSLTLTLTSTFKHVRVYQFYPKVLSFLASNHELEPEKNALITGQPFIDNPLYYSDLGIDSVEAVLASLAFDDEGARRFSESGEIITDDFNILGTRSALAIDAKKTLSYESLQRIILEHSPLYSPESWIHTDLSKGVNFPSLINYVYSLNTPAFNRRMHELNAAQGKLTPRRSD